jgi:hypothetical protein
VAARRRLTALGGLVGPAGFVTAWAVGGAVARDYSPVDDAISRLAAVDASTRALMTGGFVVFGVGVPLYGMALRERLPGPAWASAVATGVATLGVAAFPLDRSSTVDLLHGACASAGYATLAAVPLLAARPLRDEGRARAAVASLVAGVFSGACLLATLAGTRHGLLQRAGLSAGDAWIVASAVWLLRDRSGTRC